MTTTTTSAQVPDQGQMVSVRSRNWMVTDVSASTLTPARLQTGLESPQHLLTLSSVEDDGMGEELNGLWELEPGARVIEKVALPDPPPCVSRRQQPKACKVPKRSEVLRAAAREAGDAQTLRTSTH